MLTIRSPFGVALVALLSLLTGDVLAAPQNRAGRKGSGKTLTLQQQAAQIPQGISQATDGSTILDTNAVSINFFLSQVEFPSTNSGLWQWPRSSEAPPGFSRLLRPRRCSSLQFLFIYANWVILDGQVRSLNIRPMMN